MKLLISACLLGKACRWDGRAGSLPEALRALPGVEWVPVCPEVLGGLPVPRVPCERAGERVLTREGRDMTDAFRLGARRALAIARANGCEGALLKARSPSCGSGRIYSGAFDGTTVDGDGVAAELLSREGIAVFTEEDAAGLKAWIGSRMRG